VVAVTARLLVALPDAELAPGPPTALGAAADDFGRVAVGREGVWLTARDDPRCVDVQPASVANTRSAAPTRLVVATTRAASRPPNRIVDLTAQLSS
jgi:hypothetical protein